MSQTRIIIEPGRAGRNYWRDIWRYRELFYFLAWRDILVRYKQTVIGVAWALIRPFLTMIVFTIVFNRIAKLPAPGSVPYALLVLAAMLPWQFFASSLTESSTSLINNANLISKIYFPRLVVPASSVITSFVDLVISLLLMAALMWWYNFWPDSRIATLPLFIALAISASLGAGFWLCALTVKYRDFRFIVQFLVQFGIFVSPVGYASDGVPVIWKWHHIGVPARLLYSFNPMVGVIDGFRWALLRGESPLWLPGVCASIVFTAILCFSGAYYFRRTEQTFADII